jgi:adenylate kinase family enzyme
MSNDFRLPWGKQHELLDKYSRWRKQAEILKLSSRAKQKLEWFIYYHEKSHQKALVTCRYFGISKSVFYKWLSVFDPTNLKALEEYSRAPITRRDIQVTGLEEDRILSLRKANPEFGKMKLRVLYAGHYKEIISSWKIQRVIEKYHLQRKPTKPGRGFKKQSLSKRKTIELKKQHKPGFLVAFDTIVLYHEGKQRYIVTGIDTVSKIAWARMYGSHSSATTKDLFIRLYAVVKGNILNTCHDNGSEFEKHFSKLLSSMKIPQYFSRVKTPKDNPVCERFNGTLKREFLRMGNYTSDIQEFNRRLTQWLLKYNYYRPHQSLNYLTPFQYHFKQSTIPVLSTM